MMTLGRGLRSGGSNRRVSDGHSRPLSAIVDQPPLWNWSSPGALFSSRRNNIQPMAQGIAHIALSGLAALALGGCGFADVRSPVPEFMRARAADPAPPEPPPDVKHLVRDELD